MKEKSEKTEKLKLITFNGKLNKTKSLVTITKIDPSVKKIIIKTI